MNTILKHKCKSLYRKIMTLAFGTVGTFISSFFLFASIAYAMPHAGVIVLAGHAGLAALLAKAASALAGGLIVLAAMYASFARTVRRLFASPQVVNKECIAQTSFELRTALNNIIGYAELLLSGKVATLTSTQEEYITDILTSAEDLKKTLAIDIEQEPYLTAEAFARILFKLRRALGGMLGFANLLLEGQADGLSSENKEYVGYITASSNEILCSINNLTRVC